MEMMWIGLLDFHDTTRSREWLYPMDPSTSKEDTLAPKNYSKFALWIETLYTYIRIYIWYKYRPYIYIYTCTHIYMYIYIYTNARNIHITHDIWTWFDNFSSFFKSRCSSLTSSYQATWPLHVGIVWMNSWPSKRFLFFGRKRRDG